MLGFLSGFNARSFFAKLTGRGKHVASAAGTKECLSPPFCVWLKHTIPIDLALVVTTQTVPIDLTMDSFGTIYRIVINSIGSNCYAYWFSQNIYT